MGKYLSLPLDDFEIGTDLQNSSNCSCLLVSEVHATYKHGVLNILQAFMQL